MGRSFQIKTYLCILAMKLSPSFWGPASWRKSKPWKSIGVGSLFFIKPELVLEESENFLAKLFQFKWPDWSSQKVDPGPALCVNQFIKTIPITFTFTRPSQKQIIRPEIFGHIRREELLGIVLNQLPASMCIWEQCNIFFYSLMSNSKFSLDNIFTLKSRQNLHFSKKIILILRGNLNFT